MSDVNQALDQMFQNGFAAGVKSKPEQESIPEVFPEAGGVAFTTIYTKTGLPINVTARSVTPFGAVKSLVQAITQSMAEYGMTTDKPMPPNAQAPKQDAAVKIALDEGNPQMAAEIQANAEAVPLSTKGAGVQYQTFDADTIKVLPQPDDKTKVEFWQTGRQYPDVTVQWGVSAVDGLMKHVTSESMAKPGNYSLRCRVYYTEGKAYINKAGKQSHYKDVEHVRPI